MSKAERQAGPLASGPGDPPEASGEAPCAPSGGSRAPATFEKELENLERAVDLLERGDLDLEDAIRQYESGHRSLKRCYAILESVEKRIEILTRAAGASPGGKGPVWSPFEEPRKADGSGDASAGAGGSAGGEE